MVGRGAHSPNCESGEEVNEEDEPILATASVDRRER